MSRGGNRQIQATIVSEVTAATKTLEAAARVAARDIIRSPARECELRQHCQWLFLVVLL